MEKPVTFRNRNGCTLFGMLYVPEDAASRRVGIIISVNAIKYRLGTFRLHVLLARKLCNLGYTVLTFDPEGIGDSEGVFEYKLLSEHYFDIQTGKYTDDLSCAIDHLHSQSLVDSVVLFGLCGGAVSVLIAGCVDERVGGMILLNTPVLVEDLARKGSVDNAAKITSTEAASSLLMSKIRRLYQPAFWRRALSFQVDFLEEARLVRRGIVVLIKSVGSRLSHPMRRAPLPERDVTKPVSSHQLFNMHFQKAFFEAVDANKKLLFVFAEFDPWSLIFKSEFQGRLDLESAPFSSLLSISTISAANHIFSAADSQRDLDVEIVRWLGKESPGSGDGQGRPTRA